MALIDLKVPSVGESITEVSLSRWLKEDGAIVALDEIICEFDSDKATLEYPAEAAGRLIHVAKEGDDLPIGAVVARIDTAWVAPASKPETSAKETATKQQSTASPAAAKIMREADLQPTQVSGTGKDGRITKQDVVETLAQHAVEAPKPVEPAENKMPSLGSSASQRNERSVKLSRMRRTIAKRLVEAKQQTAMLTTFNEVDMSALIDLRKSYNEAYEKKYGIKIGFMSLFAKACAQILLEMPEVNARLEDDHLIFHDYVDAAIAISTPTGLVVPPIRNVESISIHAFEEQLKILAEKARIGTLSIEEMTGGTFTITNGGVFGSLLSTPIINQPQSAILGMHAIKERPIAEGGQVVIKPMMYLALSYDHRVIDGSSSVRFLVRVKELLEDPIRMYLGL